MKLSFSLMLFVCDIFFKYCFSEFYGYDACQLGLSDVSFDYVVGVRQIRSFPECCGFCTELGTCRSVTFDRVTGTCNLIGQAVSADLMSCLEDSSGQVSYAVKSTACRTSIRYNCDNNTICLDNNSECRDGICKCLPGLHHDPNTCSCISECPVYGQEFQVEIQTYIAGANKKIIRKLTQQECLQVCVSESSFQCRSVEFKSPPGVCRLQNTTTYRVPTGQGKGCASNMGSNCSTTTDCLDDISTCYEGTCRCFAGLRYDPDSCACTTGCTQYADTYQAMNNMYVVNSDRLEFTGVSPTWCLDKCNTYTGFVCRIAEYFSASTTCQIQAQDMTDVGGALHSTTATTYLRECEH